MRGPINPKSIVYTACLLALLGATYGASYAYHQTIGLTLVPNDNGAISLKAWTVGASLVTLDSSKLRLFARPHVNGAAIASKRQMMASFGHARSTRLDVTQTSQPPPYYVQDFSIPVKLAGPPGPPGTYDVWPRTIDGFATARDGTSVPLDKRLANDSQQLWWPDESGNDRELAGLRRQFVGHLVYGYGGIAISCRPAWTKFYAASTPVRVRSIMRERGHITWLGTGSAASAPDAPGIISFIAFDPLEIVVEEPSSARYPPLGTNYVIKGLSSVCPEIELADWQLDTTLSLHPPPTGVGAEQAALRVGMTRDEVVWTRGYPNEVATRTVLRAESTWIYGVAIGRYTVTFVNDRVASFTIPRGT